ncbi:MAG: nucleotidyltransferase domain-containing protein [Bacteroidales bacterium]|nr:nucleotidyltransferase domain-containing protein [Bacteroidales bacterium]MCD8395337.1 nucleotidyltransferase domain-containing protein [Bacteroidales bacterium]
MLSDQIKEYVPQIAQYFERQPAVLKAWLFGSCSRGEEKADSDIDMIVAYDRNHKVTLLTISRMSNELEDYLGRKVDLVEDGRVMSFALPYVNHDKILIYERGSKR